MRTRTLLTVAASFALPSAVLAGPPRYLARQVPVSSMMCGGSGNVMGVATALGADGSVAGEVGCGTTTYGSHGFYVSPEGVVSDLDGGSFTFSGPDFIIGQGVTVGTGDWCPPVNGTCLSAITRSSVGGPTVVIASDPGSAPYITSGNMGGWASGWGSVSPTNAWRLRPDGTFEPLGVTGAWGIYAEQVSLNGFAAGHAYVSNQNRAVRWNAASSTGTVLPSLIAGTSSTASAVAEDGSVAGRSGDQAVLWDFTGSPVALLPQGTASETTHIAGNPILASPIAMAYFGTHANGTRLFRANMVTGWSDLGPANNNGQSFIQAHVVAAPRATMMVAQALTPMYQPVNFLWTPEYGLAELESFIVGLPAGTGQLSVVDANAAGQILVNATTAHKTYLLEELFDGDTDGDGIVDGADLGRVLGAWGQVPAGTHSPCDFDLNHIVDGADLGVVLAFWTMM